jgi:hypothetical protein
MSTVFICYRRETAAAEARNLFNDLVAQLGKNSVFMDVDSIALGRDFRNVLQETLASCDLMLVLIGRNWADVKDEGGRTRLGDPGDFVRLEIEAALKRDIVVTPVLVQGALMPDADQLPTEIKDLAYRNGFELSHNRWESDVREMIKRLDLDVPAGGRQIETDRLRTAPGEATRWPVPPPQANSKRWRVWVLLSALIVVASGGWLWLRYVYTPSPSEIVRSALAARTVPELAKILVVDTVCDPLGRGRDEIGPPLDWFLRFSGENPLTSKEVVSDKLISLHYLNKSFRASLSLSVVDEIALAQIEQGKITRFVVYFPEASISQLKRACDKAGNPKIWDIPCPDFISMAQERAALASAFQRGDGSSELPGC